MEATTESQQEAVCPQPSSKPVPKGKIEKQQLHGNLQAQFSDDDVLSHIKSPKNQADWFTFGVTVVYEESRLQAALSEDIEASVSTILEDLCMMGCGMRGRVHHWKMLRLSSSNVFLYWLGSKEQLKSRVRA